MKEESIKPTLRFPGFSGELTTSTIGDIAEVTTGNKDTQNSVMDGDYPFFVRSQSVERIDTYSYDGEAVLTSGDGVGVGKNFHYINGKFDFHQRVYCLRNFSDNVAGSFLFYYFSEKFNRRVMRMTAKNSVDSVRREMVVDMPLTLPPLPEQQKIAAFLSGVDERIGQLARMKELLLKYKKGAMQQIFSQTIRFKDDNGNDYPAWDNVALGDLLEYEQPTKYLVSDTEYDDEYTTPVLTAGKTFILGYTNETTGVFRDRLPVIIFDDFTTASKFVDFPFKAKSSAMKILLPRKGTNLRFVFESIQRIKFVVGGHERHWISKYSYLPISLPCPAEQERIVRFLSGLDSRIEYVNLQVEKTKTFKKGLLQQMFV